MVFKLVRSITSREQNQVASVKKENISTLKKGFLLRKSNIGIDVKLKCAKARF